MIALLVLAFSVNILVAGGVGAAIWRGAPGMNAAFGPDAPARRILACVYLTIAATSLVGLVCVAAAPATAADIGRTLFAVQLVYKLMTAVMLGTRHPVVRANLMICVVLMAVLISL